MTINSLPSTVTEVAFGSQLQTIGARVLESPRFTSVTIKNSNLYLTVDGNGIYSKDKTTLKRIWGHPATYIVPEGVKIIGRDAFCYQTNLRGC